MEESILSKKDTVLIIDDDQTVCNTFEAFLLREGYNLLFAFNGEEGLKLIYSKEPDCILLDVMMPGMDGFSVCRKIKTDKNLRHIPVIIVTSLDTKKDIIMGFEAGADEFLSKPLDGYELRGRVKAMLRIKKYYDELKSIFSMREDLSHMIVHDMNNIITAIIGYGSVLKKSFTSPTQLEDIEKIIKYGNHLQDFINDILLIAKSQKDKLVLNRTETDPKKLIMNSEETFRATAMTKKIKLITEVPQENLSLSIDKSLFQRLLDNIISNSIKFAPSGTSVTLRLEYLHSPQSARFSILDEGEGIDKEKRDKIFNMFDIIDMKKKHVRQVGLGLAFCKMVTDAHGGRIFVEDNNPKGSVFIVEI